MTYVVLARKYRPRRFADMVGQDATVRALSNALTQQRLHHAYLFTGTRGIGKTTVSRILAKCLNCTGADGQGGITAEPCGVCSACQQIDEDRFIDYIEMDAASNRGIGEIRDLLERAAYKPSVGRFKVFMIDEAHQLTKDAFNALLKTLEEPPEYLKFVLATTDPQRMLPTVLSRCLQFNLRPMAAATVHEHLAHVLQAEGIAHDRESLVVLAQSARGSMRDALSLTDQAIAFGGGQLQAQGVREMLGTVGREAACELVRALAERDGRAVVLLLDGLRDQGASADGTLEALANLLQDMAIEQAAPNALDDDTVQDATQVRALAAHMPADDVQLLYSMVLQGRRELAWAPDAHAGLTMVLLRLLAFPTVEGPSGAGQRVAPSAQTVSSVKEPVAKKVVSADAARADAAQADPAAGPDARGNHALADRWAQVVGGLNERQLVQALVRELAMQAQLSDVNERATPVTWTLTVASETLAAPAHVEKLAVALRDYLAGDLTLKVNVGETNDTPAMRANAHRDHVAAQAAKRVQDDPLVREMMQAFPQARIVPGSIQTTPEFKP
jgi:DNA polymerase III subunit gamma/tau